MDPSSTLARGHTLNPVAARLIVQMLRSGSVEDAAELARIARLYPVQSALRVCEAAVGREKFGRKSCGILAALCGAKL